MQPGSNNYSHGQLHEILASSPGHSYVFNVTHRKGRGPGTQPHMSDVSPGTNLETTELCVGEQVL